MGMRARGVEQFDGKSDGSAISLTSRVFIRFPGVWKFWRQGSNKQA